jgi:hypothetical protein
MTIWHGTMEISGFNGENLWRTADLLAQHKEVQKHAYILTAMSNVLHEELV